MPELLGYTDILKKRYFNLKKLTEKPTLIHFWSVSCPDCKKRFPQITKLAEEYDQLIHVISIHMPRTKEDREIDRVQDIADEFQLMNPILIDNQYKLTNAFGTKYVPSYFLFDENMKLRHYQSNGSIRMLRRRIDRLVKEK